MKGAKKKLIVIAGPTASGKTGVAISVARHFDTEIISADSRQCYQELNIGVARPTNEQLAIVTHHFIASHSVQEPVTAALYEKYALEKAAEIFKKKDVVVVCGGTGLYIQALCFGLDAIPPTDEKVRNAIRYQYHHNGLTWLQQQVQKEDPEFFSGADVENPHRLMRALEVKQSTGNSILSFQQQNAVPRPFESYFFRLELPRMQLHHQINNRVEEMMKNGLLEEVAALVPYKHLQPLQTVGYQEVFSYLEGRDNLPAAVEKIKAATRQYAKRQITWFKNKGHFKPVPPSASQLISQIKEY